MVSAISIRVPLAASYAEASSLFWRLSGLLLVILAGLFFIQFWFSQRLLFAPIRAIRDTALRISTVDEQLGEEIPLHPGRELRELATAFNAMLLNLRRGRDLLEMHVEERTAELRKENRERRRAEEQVRTSLREKETLLQEIHYRVKNNLQVVSSLLTFQSDALDNEETTRALQESKNRIQAMARVHEHLYRSENLAQIDMASYIKEPVSYLGQSYWAYDVICRVEVAGVALDVDTATPCGLLINELVSNGMKHAFPTQEEAGPAVPRGEILVALRAEGDELVLTVSDDGAGLPEDVDMETATSLGLRLVEMLTRQLQGRLEVDRGRESGTSFTVTFPAPG